MELTRITKLLLWLLSKRPDIDNIGVQESETTDYLWDLEPDELYADLTPDEQRLLQIEYFEDCLHRTIDDQTA